MSYIGLFSYYQFDNWAYQPSYVSSNTPWFFNGVRIQIFPTEHLKIEPWFTNGWQSYGRFNGRPAVGIPTPLAAEWLAIGPGNQYALGEDALNTPAESAITPTIVFRSNTSTTQKDSWTKPPSRLPEIWDASMVAASAAAAILRRVPSRAFWVT